MNNYIEEFKNAMRDNGLEPPVNIIPDGVLHRFNGHKKGAGWYTLFSGEFWAGAFGDWSTDLKVKWRQDSPERTVISAQQREDWDKKRKQGEADKIALQEQAAKRARHIYGEARLGVSRLGVYSYNHPYCAAKGIKLNDDIDARVSDGVLIIKIYNSDMAIVNLQTILGDGTKKFQYGAKIKGCFGLVEYPDLPFRNTIYIAEGWATSVSIRNYFKKPCFVAFSAGNLKPVALNLRALYPDAKIIIAADNDISGVGEKAAIEAAKAIMGSYIIPGEIGDFNDLFGG